MEENGLLAGGDEVSFELVAELYLFVETGEKGVVLVGGDDGLGRRGKRGGGSTRHVCLGLWAN